MKPILHILDHSLPEQSGYASRSHAILSALAGHHGVNVEAITSPKQGPCENEFDDIDNIRYWRSQFPHGMATGGITGQVQTIRYTAKSVRARVAVSGAGLLHAHSPCLNGLATSRIKLPLVYEMRSSWEDAAVSNGTTTEGSLRYRVSRALETRVARDADAVVVICEGLKQELIERGLRADKITVVPNALPDSMFLPVDDADVNTVRDRYNLRDKKVIGFFGSFFDWEGVDALVETLPVVLAAVPDACLLLAGGGLQEAGLKARGARLGLGEKVIFAGRLPSADVRACYRAADLMVYPRIKMRLTDMVTPLKPLEAMAHGVPVLASDVGGHRELIENGKTGVLYKAGDNDALAAGVVDILEARVPTTEIAQAARAWVERERRWSVAAERYLSVYDLLLTRTTF